MSSYIEIDKTCEYCGKVFKARTLYTRYCSHICNGRHYKAIKRQGYLNEHLTVPTTKKSIATATTQATIAEISSKEYLSVTETCVLVGVSRNTLLKWIKGKLLTSYQHGTKYLIKREDINKIFTNGK